MSFKSVLAGPSRAATSMPKTHLLAAKRQITIPHPDLTLPEGVKGGNQFQIKTTKDIPDVLTVFACIRAAEKALGTSVISIDVDRDTELLKPTCFIHFTTLRPVEFTKPIVLSIVPPKTTTSDIYGGPSLEDFRTVFRTTPKEAESLEKGFRFKIVINDVPGVRQTPRRVTDNWKVLKFIREENERVLDALEKLGGGWADIADKWAHLRPNDPAYEEDSGAERRPTQGDRRRPDSAGSSEEDGDLQELGSKARGRADRREAKNRRQDDEEMEADEHRDEEDETLELRRQESNNIRELRHQQRAQREAERNASKSADAVSDWKFAIGDGQTQTHLAKDLALSPEDIEAATKLTGRFSLSKLATPKATKTEQVPVMVDQKAEETSRKEDEAERAAKRTEAEATRLEEEKKIRFKERAVEQARKDAQGKAYREKKLSESSADGESSATRASKVDPQSTKRAGGAMNEEEGQRRSSPGGVLSRFLGKWS